MTGTATDKIAIALFALSLALHDFTEGKPFGGCIMLFVAAINLAMFIAILARRA